MFRLVSGCSSTTVGIPCAHELYCLVLDDVSFCFGLLGRKLIAAHVTSQIPQCVWNTKYTTSLVAVSNF